MLNWAMLLAGSLACVFAIAMVLQRSLYSAALCLLAVVFLAAGLFMLFGSPLVAFLQIMIYAGAVMVLIVVTIMASRPTAERFAVLSVPRPVAILAGAGVLAELLMLSFKTVAQGSRPAVSLQAKIGPILFSSYALATEAVTLLLFLSALAVLDARKSE